MSLERLPEWLLPLWRNLRARDERFPHALLFCGPEGSGKRLFANHLARALLCQQPDEDGFSCGCCADCLWINAGNHPDLFSLIPAADEILDDPVEEVSDSIKKEKAKSTQIVIDQVRSLQASLEVGAGGHAGGRRLVIVDPAESMNLAASNALLKALEEPNGRTVYLMLSHAPGKLLPTIRSRCQVIDFPRPAATEAAAWLKAAGVSDFALLGFCSGLPLAARALSQSALVGARKQLAEDLCNLGGRDPLRLAADWESRLKAKGAAEAGLNLPLLVVWLLRWLSDGARCASGGVPRFFADHVKDLERLSKGRADAWMTCYREMLEHRKLASHPLNQRLFLEEITLMLCRRLLSS